MSSYRLCSLYSGSSGNAAYLETPEARILIDAGKCARTLIVSLGAIGVSIDTVDAIFVTHEHNDHVAALEVLTKKHPIPIHMLYDCAMRYRADPPQALLSCMYLYREPGFSVQVGDVTVTSFRTPHDSRGSVGYHFDIAGADGGVTRVGYATDIGYVTDGIRESLTGCESVVLESNHDENLLMVGPYPYDLKLRIRSKRGHLSNRDCADFASELCMKGTKNLLLAHLSEQNNNPDLAYDETASVLAGLGVNLRIAAPDRVVMLVGDMDRPIPKITPDRRAQRAPVGQGAGL